MFSQLSLINCAVKVFMSLFSNKMIGLVCPSLSVPKQVIEAILNGKSSYSTFIKNPQSLAIKTDQHLPLYLLSEAPISVYDSLSHPIAILTVFTNKDELADLNFAISNFFVDKPFMDINCLEYTIMYQLTSDAAVPNVNHILTSPSKINVMLDHFYSQLYPFIEAMLHNLHEQVGAIRRGLTGRFFSTTRKMWKSTDMKSNYTYLDPELQTRKLADLAYFIKDYGYCASLYDTLRRDFITDQKIEYASHCESMQTLITVQSTNNMSFENTMFSLFVYHQQPYDYLIELINKVKERTVKPLNTHILIQVVLKCKTNTSLLLYQLLSLLTPRLSQYVALLILHLNQKSTDSVPSDIFTILSQVESSFLIPHCVSILSYANDDLKIKLAQKILFTLKHANQFEQCLPLLPEHDYIVSVPQLKAINLYAHSSPQWQITGGLPQNEPLSIQINVYNPLSFIWNMNNITIHIINSQTKEIQRISTTLLSLKPLETFNLKFDASFQQGHYLLSKLTFEPRSCITFELPLNQTFEVNTKQSLTISHDLTQHYQQYECIPFTITLSSSTKQRINFEWIPNVVGPSQIDIEGQQQIQCVWYVKDCITNFMIKIKGSKDYSLSLPMTISPNSKPTVVNLDETHFQVNSSNFKAHVYSSLKTSVKVNDTLLTVNYNGLLTPEHLSKSCLDIFTIGKKDVFGHCFSSLLNLESNILKRFTSCINTDYLVLLKDNKYFVYPQMKDRLYALCKLNNIQEKQWDRVNGLIKLELEANCKSLSNRLEFKHHYKRSSLNLSIKSHVVNLQGLRCSITKPAVIKSSTIRINGQEAFLDAEFIVDRIGCYKLDILFHLGTEQWTQSQTILIE